MPCAVVDFAGWLDDKAGSRHHNLERRGDGRAVKRIKEGRGLFGSAFFDEDDNGVAVFVPFQGCMEAVGELQMQSVLTGRERQLRLKRAVSEMEMLLVGGDDLSGGNEVGVDENVHVSRIGNYIARRVNLHPYGAHLHNESGRYDCIAGRLSEENLGQDRLLLALFVLRWRLGRRLLISLLLSLSFRFNVGGGQGRLPFRVAGRLQLGAKTVDRRVDDIDENEEAQDRAADSDQGVNSVH